MSQFYLPCDCGAKSTVNRSQAGMSITCSQCHRQLEVPTIRGFQTLEAVETTRQSDVDRTQAKPNIAIRILAGVFFLIAAATLGYGSVLAYQIYTFPMDMSRTKEQFLLDTEASLSALTPAETWDTWNSLTYAGLTAAQTPEYFRIQHAYQDALRQMYWFLGAGGIASLAFIACLLLSPKKTDWRLMSNAGTVD